MIALTPILFRPHRLATEVVFQKDHSVYLASLNPSGRFAKGGMPKCIHGFRNGDELEGWTLSGLVRVYNGIDFFVLDREANWNRRPMRWMDQVWRDPNNEFAVIGPVRRGNLIKRYLKRNVDHVLLANAENVAISSDGTTILATESKDPQSFEQTLVAFDLKTSRQIFKGDLAVNLTNLKASRNQKFITFMSHLSRPLTGDQVYALGNMQKYIEMELPRPGWSAPTLVDDFSADTNRLLISFRHPDPNNDGSWLGAETEEWTPKTGHLEHIAAGEDAFYSENGAAILYLSKVGKRRDLVRFDRKLRTTEILIRGVHQLWSRPLLS